MSETGPGPEDSEEIQNAQEPTRGRRTKKVLGIAAEELKDWRGERRDAAAERRAQFRAAADEAEQARFDPILTQVERDGADASGTFGGDKHTGKDAPRDLDALTRMDLAERDTPVQGSEWPLDGLRRGVEELPNNIRQRRADRKTHREEKAREAVAEAAAKVPEGPERADLTARVDRYVEELEREEVFARVNGGISTVEIDNPDDELRQALYKKFDVREAEIWYNEADQSKPKVWQGLTKTASTPMRAVRYVKQRMTGLKSSEAADTHFEVRRYLVGNDNETVIEESWLQLKAGVKGDGKPGDMSLASTRLIRVEGGAYEENERGKLLASKALRAFQQLPRTKIPEMYQDLEPPTDVELPPEGPRPGSLSRDKVFPPSVAPVDRGVEGVRKKYRLPPAPEPRRPAVSPTQRPEAPVVPEQTTEPETAAATAAPKAGVQPPEPAAAGAEFKPPEPAAAGETAEETEPEPQPAAGGSSEPAPTATGPELGSEPIVEAKPASGESELGGGEHAAPAAGEAPSGAEVPEPLAETGEVQKGEDPEITILKQSVRQKYPDFDFPGSGQLLPTQVERMVEEADTPAKFEAIRSLIRSRSAQSSQDKARINPARGEADESQASADARIAGQEAALMDIVQRRDRKLQQEHSRAERALLRAESERLRVEKERLVEKKVPEVTLPASFQDDYDADRAASERNSSGNVVNYRKSSLPQHKVGTSESEDPDVRQAANMASERRKLAEKASRAAATDKAQAGSKTEKPKRGSGRGEQVRFRIDAQALRKVEDQAEYEQARDALIAEALNSGYIVKDEGARLGVRRSADPKSVEFIHELMEGWQTVREAKVKREQARRTKAKQTTTEKAAEPDIGSTSEAVAAQVAPEKVGDDAEGRKEIVSRIIALSARTDVNEAQREIEFAYLIKEAIDARALGAYRNAGLGFRALSNNDESAAYAKQIRSAYEHLDLAKPKRPGKSVSGEMNNEGGEAAAAPTFATQVTQPEITSPEPEIEPVPEAPELIDDLASSAEAADLVGLSRIEDRMVARLDEIRETTDAKGRRAKIKRVSKEASTVGLAKFTDGVLSPVGEPGSIRRTRSEQFIEAMEALSTASEPAAEDETEDMETEEAGHDRSTGNVRGARQARDSARREANNNGS